MIWSEDEIKFIKDNYVLRGGKFVSEKLNRTIESVKKKAKRLKLINSLKKHWSEFEINFLKENYNKNGCKFVCETLDRSKNSIKSKARFYGLSVNYQPTISKQELEDFVKISYCYSDLMRNLNKVVTGASLRIIRKYVLFYDINTEHFDPFKKHKENCIKGLSVKYPIEYWLTFGSKISSRELKLKLYKEDLKNRKCELCGQGEEWQGKKMSLILDHINGVNNDNRLENLRIVCPNCNATLDTHCGKNIKRNDNKKEEIKRKEIERKENNGRTIKQINSSFNQRKVNRPNIEILKNEVKEMGYSATGRKYGVSDNTIRKWVK